MEDPSSERQVNCICYFSYWVKIHVSNATNRMIHVLFFFCLNINPLPCVWIFDIFSIIPSVFHFVLRTLLACVIVVSSNELCFSSFYYFNIFTRKLSRGRKTSLNEIERWKFSKLFNKFFTSSTVNKPWCTQFPLRIPYR